MKLLLECRADVDVSSSSCIAGMTACALQVGILALYIRLLLVVDCLGSLTGVASSRNRNSILEAGIYR